MQYSRKTVRGRRLYGPFRIYSHLGGTVFYVYCRNYVFILFGGAVSAPQFRESSGAKCFCTPQLRSPFVISNLAGLWTICNWICRTFDYSTWIWSIHTKRTLLLWLLCINNRKISVDTAITYFNWRKINKPEVTFLDATSSKTTPKQVSRKQNITWLESITGFQRNPSLMFSSTKV